MRYPAGGFYHVHTDSGIALQQKYELFRYATVRASCTPSSPHHHHITSSLACCIMQVLHTLEPAMEGGETCFPWAGGRPADEPLPVGDETFKGATDRQPMGPSWRWAIRDAAWYRFHSWFSV